MASLVNRRRVLAAIGTSGLIVGAEMGVGHAMLAPSPEDQGSVLVDGRFLPAEQRQIASILADRKRTSLDREIVWQWRRDLLDKLMRAGALEIMTRWDNSLIFTGLAREIRANVVRRRIAGNIYHLQITKPA
ncbi:MAG: hypothetical protein E2598_01780 [Sphingobium sp.]|nr:hypothetical protein [Sphingobium sp.]